MKKLRRGAALLMAAATLTSLPAIPFAAPEIPAAAAEIQTIQTRVFRYDFGSFYALYDTRGGKWYDESGTLLKSLTEPVQEWKSAKLTVDFEQKEAYILKSDGTKQMNSAVTEFLQNTLTAFVPDYATEYYDKAQQKYIAVPKPESFPLTFRVLQDTNVFTVEVLLGENSLGQFTGSEDMIYQGDGSVGCARPDAFTDSGDLTVDGSISIADAVCSNRIAAEDTGVRISALGLELADEDGDGMVGIGDVRALLDELVKPLRPERSYMLQISDIYAHETLRDLYTPEEMSVFLTDGSEQWITVHHTLTGSLEQTARYHGYYGSEQMFSAFDEDEYGVHFLADCEPGEEYDKWYLSFIGDKDHELKFKYLEIDKIELSDAGLLTVFWKGLEKYPKTEQYYNAFTHVLTVKHGIWDEIKGTANSMNFYSDEEQFAAEVGRVLDITRTETRQQGQLSQNAIPVLHDEMESVEWLRSSEEDRYSEYKNWAGKEDFELARQTLCKDYGDEMIAVLPLEDELKVYTVYWGLPREHRLVNLNLTDDGTLTVYDIADMRPKRGYQNDCTSHRMTIFADTLKLPKGALPAEKIKSVDWDKLERFRMDADTALAEDYGYPWDETQGNFPHQCKIFCQGCDYTSLKSDETIILNKRLHDSVEFVHAEPDENGNGDGTGGWYSVYSTADLIAKQHGYADAAAMLNDNPTDDGPKYLINVTEGAEYDQWYLTCLTDRYYSDCRIDRMDLNRDGRLSVTWNSRNNSAVPGTDSNIFSHVLTVRHGIWDSVKSQSFDLRKESPPYNQDPLKVFFEYRDIAVTAHEVLRDQYTVNRQVVASEDASGNTVTEEVMSCQTVTGDLEKIAKIHKYRNGTEMIRALEDKAEDTDGVKFMVSCEEGEESDKWYLSFFFDKPHHRCEISDLELSFDMNGTLFISLSLLDDADSGEIPCNVFTHILTVEPGLWKSVSGYWIHAKEYDSTQKADFQASYSEALDAAVIFSGRRASSAFSEVITTEQTQEKVMAEPFDLEQWDGREDYELAQRKLSCANGDTNLALLQKDDRLQIYVTDYAWDCECRIEHLNLERDGKLTVTVAMYPWGDEQYRTVFANTLILPEELAVHKIYAVELKVRYYNDPFDEYEAVRGEQWEAFQKATEYTEYFVVNCDGIPIYAAYR